MLLSLFTLAACSSQALTLPHQQKPLLAEQSNHGADIQRYKKLHGRFLHITDFHPDQFYKPFTSTDNGVACHRGSGPAGVLGAQSTDCDSPYTLVNATFQWLNDHVKDSIDFIIWTGDSARHDSDEKIPRTETQLLESNEMLVDKFREVFGKSDKIDDPDPTNHFIIPIVPTFGNNDIMPHNIMDIGPNFWTKKFAHVWRNFIPEAQKHNFDRGGWFFVEVIPNKLAVFNLNTMYFFNHNTAVDGCAKSSEPGYEQMQWLRIQLQFLRERGLKAIMTGHIPPAKTDNKQAWDTTCWQLYTLWMRRYRDVVVGSMYGHMNIDHFMLQDFHNIKKKTKKGKLKQLEADEMESLDDEISIESSIEYLADLRDDWAKIPDAPESMNDLTTDDKDSMDVLNKKHKKHKSKADKYLKKIGGEWAERYSVSLVSASVVPNYFPSFRVVEYNISGLDNIPTTSPSKPAPDGHWEDSLLDAEDGDIEGSRKKHKKHKKTPKKPNYATPSSPTESSPPGPAYSPQSLSWLSYKQYYANLTRINADSKASISSASTTPDNFHETDHKHHPQNPHFTFELEYDTANDTIFALPDLSVRSWVDLARRIGHYDPSYPACEPRIDINDDVEIEKKHKKKRKGKRKGKKKREEAEKLWFTFLRRAYVGAKGEGELREEFEGL